MQKIFYFGLICFLFFPCAWASKLADDNTGRDDTQVFHVYEDIDLVSTLKFFYDKQRIVIKTVYPQLESDYVRDSVETFNQLVLDFIQEKIAEYKKQVVDNKASQKNISKPKNDLYIDYSAAYVKAGKYPILSVRFNIQGYIAGMAHPYHRHFVMNYDLKNNQLLDLDSLFKPDENYLEVLSDYTANRLYKRMPDRSMVTEGTAPTPGNFRNWNVKQNGLLFTFDEYQVAPYVYGAQTVLVPFSVLKNLIDPASPLGSCVKRRTRCSGGSVLTGGFIDEALNIRRIDTRHGFFNPTLSQR